MKKYLYFIIVFALCACHSKTERYLLSYTRFITEIEANAETYSLQDWEQKESVLQTLKSEESMLKGQFSSDELKKIGELDARFCKVSTKFYFQKIKEQVRDGVEYGKGFISEMVNAADSIADESDDFVNEMSQIFEDAVSECESIFDENNF